MNSKEGKQRTMQSLYTITFLLTFNLFIISCGGKENKSNDEHRGGKENRSNDDHQRGSKQSFSRFTSPNFCPTAGLSEEQKEQIKNLVQGDNQNLTREERRTASQELKKKILEEVVMTEEEKTALSKCFEQKREDNKNRDSSQKQ